MRAHRSAVFFLCVREQAEWRGAPKPGGNNELHLLHEGEVGGAAQASSMSSSALLPLTAAALPLPPVLAFLPGSGPQPRPVIAPQPGPATVPGGASEVEGRVLVGLL